MKLHKIRTRFKVTIVLCPSLLKISLWRSEKGHRATWRGKYQQRNQFAAIFYQSDPEWSRPRGRVSQDHSGSLILGVRIVCGTEFRPRVTQDHSGSPRSGGSDRSWNRAIDFSQKMEVTVMAPNHGGDTIESILGPMGSHWIQKMGQNRKKLPCPKIRIFDYPAVIHFSKKMEVAVVAPHHGRDTIESILGPMGSHWVQKMGQNRKKLPCSKIRIFDYPAVIGFSQKMEVSVMAPNHGGEPLGSILGPMGSHWVKKMGQNCKKLPCPKIGIFDNPAVIDFSPKMEVTVMARNHGGDPIVSILGPVGSYWVKKWVKTVKNYHAPKFEFSITWRSSVFRKKWKLRLWRQITVGTP